MVTNHGRVLGVDARNPQDRVHIFLITNGSDLTTDDFFLNSSQVGPEAGNTSILSGLSRRVSSIWSFATSKVSVLNVTGAGASGGSGVGSSPTGVDILHTLS